MKNNVFPGYTAMTYADAEKVWALNHKNSWGFTVAQLKRLCTEHKKARANGDVRTMEKIEFRLEDCNFHSECSMLAQGDYEAYKAACENG